MTQGTYTFDKRNGIWAVLAQIDAARTGSVVVTKKDGTSEDVPVVPPAAAATGFTARFGPLQGQTVVYVKKLSAPAPTTAVPTPTHNPAPAPAAKMQRMPYGGPLTTSQKKSVHTAWNAGKIRLENTFDAAPCAQWNVTDLLAGRCADGSIVLVAPDGERQEIYKSDLRRLADTADALNAL